MKSVFMNARKALESKGQFAHGAVPNEIADSWHRSLEFGLDPNSKPIDAVVSYQEIKSLKQKNEELISVVRPELELLSNQISGTNHMTVFADCHGVVLDSIQDVEFHASQCSKNIRTGSIWREEIRGTNALGLTLHTGKTSMVTGAEHFFSNHTTVSCVATPIFDSQGKIVGLLDASSEIAARQFHTQALVSLAATNIENRLFVDEHRNHTIIQFHPREEYLQTQSVGMICTDDDGRILGANNRAKEILKGLDLDTANSFGDVFQGGYGSTMDVMLNGDIVRLVDWLNSAYFSRIRVTRKQLKSIKYRSSFELSVPAIYKSDSYPSLPVYRDEQMHNGMKLALKSAGVGMPICILGGAGSGRTTFSHSIHKETKTNGPLVVCDCQSTSPVDSKMLLAEVHGEMQKLEIAAGSCGTLVLENLDSISIDSALRLSEVTSRMIQLGQHSKWTIISTGNNRFVANPKWPSDVQRTIANLIQVKIHLPQLSERTDFQQVAISMLSNLAPDHKLSRGAYLALKSISYPQNLIDLKNRIKILAIHCPAGIIREEHVHRHLYANERPETKCSKCAGNPLLEAKCREINRVFRQCNSNVALTARRLGVSRNTVYSHLARE